MPTVPLTAAFTAAILMSITLSGFADRLHLEHGVSAEKIASRIKLTSSEHTWLSKKNRVRFRVADFPPFHMWDQGPQGISVEYAKLFCQGFYLECEFVTGVPWHEAIGRLRKGNGFDVLLTIKHTQEREKEILFTDDYLTMPWVIFSRTDGPPISGIDDLQHKKISVENGFFIHKLLREKYPDMLFLVTENSQQALAALSSGQVDAYAGNLTVGSYLSQRAGFNNIKVAAPTALGSHTQAMAVRPDWPELASLLDRFLQAVTEPERNSLTNRWLSMRFEYGIDWAFVWRVIWSILGISVTLLLAFAYWNRKLHMEIEQRETAQRAADQKSALLSCIDDLRTSFIHEPDPFRLFPRFLDRLLDLTQSEYGFVGDILVDAAGKPYLKLYGLSNLAWNEETRQLYDEDRQRGLEFRNLDNLFCRVITTGKAIISDRPKDDERGGGFPCGHPPISSFVGIPVFFGDRLVGEVGLANRTGGYDQAFLDMLSPVTSALGQIIVARWDREARNQAEAELRSLATTDPLTGLFNRRVLVDRLKILITRARRFSEQLALVLLDIDDFKAINDTYGHDTGDHVLRKVAEVLTSASRDVDLAVRWGGEEFVLLLPLTDQSTAASVAERIRAHIECDVFTASGPVTASFGVATVTSNDSAENLISRADQALYASKNAGKNQVTVWDN